MRWFAAFVAYPRFHSVISALLLLLVAVDFTSCGSSPKQVNNPNPPTQPTYPSTPPVPITWSPSSSDLPAPSPQAHRRVNPTIFR